MTVALQIRDVPEEVRDVIAARAATRGQSMQAYLLELLQREARVAANVDILQRSTDIRIEIPERLSPERVIREGRESGFAVDRSDTA
ncbi:MAG: hypothetical protein QM695_07860 [Micropruina sp.]